MAAPDENFVVGWRDQRTGLTGRGTSRFTRATAEQLCAELDTEHPIISHYPIELPPRPIIIVEGEEDGAED